MLPDTLASSLIVACAASAAPGRWIGRNWPLVPPRPPANAVEARLITTAQKTTREPSDVSSFFIDGILIRAKGGAKPKIQVFSPRQISGPVARDWPRLFEAKDDPPFFYQNRLATMARPREPTPRNFTRHSSWEMFTVRRPFCFRVPKGCSVCPTGNDYRLGGIATLLRICSTVGSALIMLARIVARNSSSALSRFSIAAFTAGSSTAFC